MNVCYDRVLYPLLYYHFQTIQTEFKRLQHLNPDSENSLTEATMPTPVTHFIDVEMENSLSTATTMMFNPTGFGLNAGQTSVVANMDVTAIWIAGVPPNIAGPYVPSGGSTVQNKYGIWLGPDPVPGGYSIEFNIVGPYPPAEAEDRASGTGTVDADAKAQSPKWERVKFAELSLDELKCAGKQLKEAQDVWKDNKEALKLIEAWLEEVSDAKKKYEPEGESKDST
ncbi:MAG: hypothetical protein M1839_008535 [Geoglossum umbratile]|nr:MAG: hypothetical protein M1839_008535 [Geoglossum umbratile]